MDALRVLDYCKTQISRLDSEYEHEGLPVEDWVHGSGAYKDVIAYIEEATRREFDPTDIAGQALLVNGEDDIIAAIKWYREKYREVHGYYPGLRESKDAVCAERDRRRKQRTIIADVRHA